MERPYPRLTPENEFFWTSGENGTLCFQRCGACGHFLHPPMPRCPACLSSDIGVVAVSGRAIVAARTVNHHPWHPAFSPPYLIALVEIEEAPYVRLTSRIVNCAPAEVDIGARVRVVFTAQGPAWLPLFELDRG